MATLSAAAAFTAGPATAILQESGTAFQLESGTTLLLEGAGGGAVLSAVASVIAAGASSAAFSGSPHLTVTASGGPSGSTLSASPAVSVTARVIKTAAAHLAGSPVLTASGVVPVFLARPVLGATALVTHPASAHLTAAPVLTAATSSSAAHLSAAAYLLVPGRAGAARLVAGTSLTVSGTYFLPGQAALYAAPVLAGAAKVTEPASAHLTASTAMAASALLHVPGTAALHASASLAAVPFTAAAHLAAPGSLSAVARKTSVAAVHLTAAGSAAAAAKATSHAAAALRASAVLAPGAVVAKLAGGALSAAAVLRAAGRRGVAAHAPLTSASVLTAQGARTAVAAAALTAAAGLTGAGQDLPGVQLHAPGSLGAGAVLSRTGRAALSAAPALAGTAHGTTFPVASFQAPGVFLPSPLGVVRAAAAFSAFPCLTAAAATRPGVPFPPRPAGQQRAWQRDVQRFAVVQERQRHAQALWQYGELVVFALMWRPQDIGLGLAQRCTRCWNPSSVITDLPPGTVPPAGYYSVPGVEQQISAAYGQGNQFRCILCYGTQVIAAAPAEVPGVRALLVRPAILTDTDQNQQRTAKGTVNTGSVAVQSTPDFRVSTLDYFFRSDGRRYQLAVPARTTLRTGFGSPWQASAAISYNLSNASLEDPKASVAYIIPPPAGSLERVLGTYTRIPADYAWFEQVNGPLIPGEDPPPAASGLYQPAVSLGT